MVEVVGLGAQDSLEDAQDFHQRHGTESIKMVWDESRVSWREMGVVTQPAAVLFDRQGRILDRWAGMFDEAEVLKLAGSA